MRITVVCGNSLGASLIMEMSTKSILRDLSVSAGIDYVDLGFVKGIPSDIYVGTKDIVEWLVAQSVTSRIATLENMADKKVMRGRLPMILDELGAL